MRLFLRAPNRITMNTSEIKAELSIKLLELEAAIDTGMPYSELKKIYSQIKELQFKAALAEVNNDATISRDDLVIE